MMWFMPLTPQAAVAVSETGVLKFC